MTPDSCFRSAMAEQERLHADFDASAAGDLRLHVRALRRAAGALSGGAQRCVRRVLGAAALRRRVPGRGRLEDVHHHCAKRGAQGGVHRPPSAPALRPARAHALPARAQSAARARADGGDGAADPALRGRAAAAADRARARRHLRRLLHAPADPRVRRVDEPARRGRREAGAWSAAPSTSPCRPTSTSWSRARASSSTRSRASCSRGAGSSRSTPRPTPRARCSPRATRASRCPRTC